MQRHKENRIEFSNVFLKFDKEMQLEILQYCYIFPSVKNCQFLLMVL